MADNSYQHLIDDFMSYCRTKNLSPESIRYYHYRLRAAVRFLQERNLDITPATTTIQHLREFIAASAEKDSICTVNHNVTVLKAFFNFLEREEIISSNPTKRLDKARAPKRLIKTFTHEQIQALLEATNDWRFSGARDRAILILMLDTGLRVSEVARLTFEDVDFGGASVRVIGKGDKERVVPLGKTARKYLQDYLSRRGDIPGTDRIFVNEYGDPVTKRTIEDSMARYGKRSGITGVRISPHTCRHTFAKNWILNGGDPFSLQQMLGHTTMDMVKRYVSLANEEVQKAHKIYSPVDRMFGDMREEWQQSKPKRRRLR